MSIDLKTLQLLQHYDYSCALSHIFVFIRGLFKEPGMISNMEIGETHSKITQDNEKTGCRSTYFSVVLRRIYEIILVIFVSLFVEYSYISIRRATNTIIYI